MPDLSAYPRPNVAVDVAALTVLPSPDPRTRPGRLAVLVQDRDHPSGRALPGRFLREGETVTTCIHTALREKAGLHDVAAEPHLLRVFDEPGRDPRAWTLSLAHALALPHHVLQEAGGDLVGIRLDGTLATGEPLLFDHDLIVAEAATRIRRRYETRPDPDGLLDRPFTLADLKTTHEAVLGERLHRDTFRRRMTPLLAPFHDAHGQQATRVDGGRPARLWVRTETDALTEGERRRLLLSRA